MDMKWVFSPAFLAQIKFYVPYLIANVAVLLLFFEKNLKGLSGNLKRALVWASIYAMAMVLPMIWAFRSSGRFAYLFMLSNIAYQVIYLHGKHKGKVGEMLVPLTLANLVALFVMLFVPYLLGSQI